MSICARYNVFLMLKPLSPVPNHANHLFYFYPQHDVFRVALWPLCDATHGLDVSHHLQTSNSLDNDI